MNAPYLEIAGGYSYASLRVGMVIKNPAGVERYVQPGDDETAMRETIDALGEIPEDKQAIIADMALAEYFA